MSRTFRRCINKKIKPKPYYKSKYLQNIYDYSRVNAREKFFKRYKHTERRSIERIFLNRIMNEIDNENLIIDV